MNRVSVGHCAAIHIPTDRKYVFGGNSADAVYSDFWVYDFSTYHLRVSEI